MAEIVVSLFLACTFLFTSGAYSSATFTLINNCEQTVWPGILSNAGVAPLSTTGFALQNGESRTLDAPSSWGGRFWGRTDCSLDSAGKFTCVTGDCGSGTPECGGGGAAPPATLAEFTLNGHDGMDFYDVSLVDGYNLPILVAPRGGGSGGNCTSTGCVADLNGACPVALKLTSSGGQSVGCKSACEAFGDPHYCCSGAFQTPDTCKPSSYSQVFKNACPRAYSYAYDDTSSTFTCSGADYVITFCPSPDTRNCLKPTWPERLTLLVVPKDRNGTTTFQLSRQKSSSMTGGGDGGMASVMDSTMVYEGASRSSIRPQPIYVALVSLLATWLFKPTPI